MFKTFTLAVSALAMGTATLVPVAAEAQRYGYERGYDREYRGNDRRYNYRNDRNNRRGCDNTGGTIVGALAGGLLGHTVAGRGNGTIGALLGAAGGGLAGNAIDKSDNPRYCRR